MGGGGGPQSKLYEGVYGTEAGGRMLITDPEAFSVFGGDGSQKDFYDNLNANKIGQDAYSKFKGLSGQLFVGRGGYNGEIRDSQGKQVTDIFNEYRSLLDKIHAEKVDDQEYLRMKAEFPGRDQLMNVHGVQNLLVG